MRRRHGRAGSRRVRCSERGRCRATPVEPTGRRLLRPAYHCLDRRSSKQWSPEDWCFERCAHVAGLLAAAGLLPTAARARLAASGLRSEEPGRRGEGARRFGAGGEQRRDADRPRHRRERRRRAGGLRVDNLPGVKRLALLVEKNPNTLAAVFDVTDAIEPNFSTRVKMGQSSNVFAVAMHGRRQGVVRAEGDQGHACGGCGGSLGFTIQDMADPMRIRAQAQGDKATRARADEPRDGNRPAQRQRPARRFPPGSSRK